jgi:uncharacterized protein (DUF488 family)
MAEYSVYTVGHGLLSWDAFARLLKPFGVEMLIDVRSFPYVEAAPWFSRDQLEHLARREGLEYLWLGGHLGPLTDDGRVDYVAREREPRYREGISMLLSLASERVCCLLGAQADPYSGHRHQLIAQTLLKHNVAVVHILEDSATLSAQPDLFHSRV